MSPLVGDGGLDSLIYPAQKLIDLSSNGGKKAVFDRKNESPEETGDQRALQVGEAGEEVP